MSVKDTSSDTKPAADVSDEKNNEEMMKLGNASLNFSHHDSHHDINAMAVGDKQNDSILGESFAIDDGYTAGRGSLAVAAEAFKKFSEDDPPIEEAEEAESSTPS
jgi:hypothetical protein